jgi:hypothetical protein
MPTSIWYRSVASWSIKRIEPMGNSVTFLLSQRHFSSKKKKRNMRSTGTNDEQDELTDETMNDQQQRRRGGKRNSLSEADVEASEGAASQFHLQTYEDKMNACIKRLQKEFSQLRSVRANPGNLSLLLEPIRNNNNNCVNSVT